MAFKSQRRLSQLVQMPFSLIKRPGNISTRDGHHLIVSKLAEMLRAPRRYRVLFEEYQQLYAALTTGIDTALRCTSYTPTEEIFVHRRED